MGEKIQSRSRGMPGKIQDQFRKEPASSTFEGFFDILSRAFLCNYHLSRDRCLRSIVKSSMFEASKSFRYSLKLQSIFSIFLKSRSWIGFDIESSWTSLVFWRDSMFVRGKIRGYVQKRDTAWQRREKTHAALTRARWEHLNVAPSFTNAPSPDRNAAGDASFIIRMNSAQS